MVNPSREEEERTRVIMDAGRARESTKVIVQKKRKTAADAPHGIPETKGLAQYALTVSGTDH